MPKLGVNIDHVATLREARKTFEPDPVQAALESERSGADGIVCHLRKDRRHIQDKDLELLRKTVKTRLNQEMSLDQEILEIALRLKPDQATIVPENRQEITTEGGLDVIANARRVKEVGKVLNGSGIQVSLFIDPERDQIDASLDSGARVIEFHTGRYAEAFHDRGVCSQELDMLERMTEYAIKKGLRVCAGHGLTYQNVRSVARIEGVHELNIGHSIISRAVFAGIGPAVREMKALIS